MSFDEAAALWSGRLAVGFTALAAIAGLFAFLFSNRVAATKDAANLELQRQTSVLQKDVADARARQATAEATLNETVIDVDRGKKEIADAQARAAAAIEGAVRLEHDNLELRQSVARLEREASDAAAREAKARAELQKAIFTTTAPRVATFPRDAFRNALQGKPTATAIVVYQPENAEAYMLAAVIRQELTASGWNAIGPDPATQRAPDQPSTSIGVSISSTRPPSEMKEERGTAYEALYKAFLSLRWEYAGVGGGPDPSLPEGVFRLAVGAR